ncbi:MAG: EutN/CcmL family microcompartment protein [Pirellulaceae bacterium]
MRIAKVIGSVTLARPHASYVGSRLRLAIPMSFAELVDGTEPTGDSLVVWDELGAGLGDLILIAEGPEASQPFRPAEKAVDAYCAALLDDVSLDPKAVAMVNREESSSKKTKKK